MPVDAVREAAVDTLIRIEENGIYLDRALDRTLQRRGDRLSPRGKRFLAQLVYATARHRTLADFILQPLVKQPLDKLPLSVHIILRMGVTQALFLNQVTFPSMVHTSVDLAKRKDNIGTSRLVNAVSRRFPESLDDVTFPDRVENSANYLRVRYSIPRWMVKRWIAEFGFDTAEAICKASNEQAAWTARVNTNKMSRDELLEALKQSEILATPFEDVPDCIIFEPKSRPLKSKLFQSGAFYIQDPASMLPPHLLEPEPEDRILDLCAAPGGKSLQMASLMENTGLVTAMDRNPRRLGRILDNIERYGAVNVAPLAADGNHPPFTGQFDRVLLDAPCSGLGTLRRHPDMKFRIKPDEIERLAEQQLELLRSAIGLCKIGGLVVYSVCTFTPEETQAVIKDVLGEKRVTLEDGPAWMERWKISQGTYQILPSESHMDGFFLTRLRVTS